MTRTQGCTAQAETITLIFIILKLTDVIDWSWWWVLSPTWIYIIIGTAATWIIKNHEDRTD